MTGVVCTFERIGRQHDVPPLTVTAALSLHADAIAVDVHGYAKQFLGSKNFVVTVDLETGKGSIEGGRFGRFTIEELT